jgi:glycosyltransferase involved in cell wall biosynthesis
MNQPWKGADLLLDALHGLPASLKDETALLLLGGQAQAVVKTAGIKTISLGRIMNDRIKAIAYSAADVFVSPSRAEAFGLVSLESMSCGTPAVAFGVGGAVDYVRHGITGYLAKRESSEDLRQGIVQLLEDDGLRTAMGQQARQMVLEEYTLKQEVESYVRLFRDLLGS